MASAITTLLATLATPHTSARTGDLRSTEDRPSRRVMIAARFQRQLADVIALGGGVPINVGNDTIGAVGVSGSSQTGDDACAKAGIAKVAEQLKTN